MSSPAPYAYIPITLTNDQSGATASNLQVLLGPSQDIPLPSSSLFSSSSTMGNVRFYADLGMTQPLFSWTELAGRATNTLIFTTWVKLASAIAGSGGQSTIYMVFLPASSNFDGYYAGVQPTAVGGYGQYDNGSLVFPWYDNFAGFSLSSAWTPFNSPNNPTSFTVFNGVTLNSTTSQWVGWYNTSYTVPQPGVIDAYFAVSSSSGDAGPGVVDSFIFENRQDNGDFRIEYAVPTPSNNDGSGGSAIQGQTYVVTGWNYLNPAMDVGYVRTVNGSGSGQVAGNPSIQVYGTAGGTGTGVFQWIRGRTYPPSGVLPSVSFGPLVLPPSTLNYNLVEQGSRVFVRGFQ